MKLSVLVCFLLTFIFHGFTQTKRKPSNVKLYSEEHARGCINDYYEFYHSDEHYSDVKFRRVSGNIFYVSLKYCSGPNEICYEPEYIGNTAYYTKPKEFFWNSKVLVLTINSKTKYTVRNKDGY